jgi:hypothetical protein
MDLNIGTAFWFASRAQGYIIPGLEVNKIDNLYDINDCASGRPLLRNGGEGAALGVGLSIHKSEPT